MEIPETLHFEPEVQADFDEVCDRLSKVFSNIGLEGTDFEIGEVSQTHRSIDLFIKRYERIQPSDVELVLPSVQELLRECREYWWVCIWVYKPDKPMFENDKCVWLEIDKYSVFSFRGKQEIELCEDMHEFYRRFWTR
jgi:hypothetical protein